MSNEKASDVVKSITPAQLEKTRSEVNAEVENKREDCADSEEVDIEGSCAGERLVKLDLIQDMQLILIDRYRGASKLLTACMVVMLLVLAAQILQFFRTMSLHGSVIVVQDEQRALLTEQRKTNRTAEESKREVAEVKKEVKSTKEKVEEAVESSPKLEVDPESGKTKVVVPVKRPKKEDDDSKGDKGDKEGPKGGGNKKPAAQSPPPPPSPIEVELLQ